MWCTRTSYPSCSVTNAWGTTHFNNLCDLMNVNSMAVRDNQIQLIIQWSIVPDFNSVLFLVIPQGLWKVQRFFSEQRSMWMILERPSLNTILWIIMWWIVCGRIHKCGVLDLDVDDTWTTILKYNSLNNYMVNCMWEESIMVRMCRFSALMTGVHRTRRQMFW